MAKRTYPGVDRVKDDALRISLRALWDRVYTIAEAQALLATAADLEALREELEETAAGLEEVIDEVESSDGSGSGSTSTEYCEPLTDGDPTSPEFIYADGDIVVACVTV